MQQHITHKKITAGICTNVTFAQHGVTVLSNLESFGERFDKRVRKAYIDGEYGAIRRITENR